MSKVSTSFLAGTAAGVGSEAAVLVAAAKGAAVSASSTAFSVCCLIKSPTCAVCLEPRQQEMLILVREL